MANKHEIKRIVLFCPSCSCQHVDNGEWATKPHSTHLCESCKNEWKPFPYHTTGVLLEENQHGK